MVWSDYHVHTRYCHGLGSLEEYLERAIEKGVKRIGFSSHAPLTGRSWTVEEKNLALYIHEVRSLQDKFKSLIDVFLGLEVDYIPGQLRFDSFRNLDLDYLIGSNHFLGQDLTGEYRRIESLLAPEILRGKVRSVLENYFYCLQEMVIKEKPDILAHMDIIKKINMHDSYFQENDDFYRELIWETLTVVLKSGVIVEVNTSGVNKKGISWPYPSREILEICSSRKIPVTLCSDAHEPPEVARRFPRALKLLKDTGFREIMVLKKDGWQKKNID